MINTEILTAKDAARILGISYSHVRALIRQHKIPATNMQRIGTLKPRYEIREDDLYRFKKVYKKHSRNFHGIKSEIIEKEPAVDKEVVEVKEAKKAYLKDRVLEARKERLKNEFGKLKERMLEIVIEMEELENLI